MNGVLWGVSLIVVVGIATISLEFFRYAPMDAGFSNEPLGMVRIWDRYKGRVCVASISLGGKPLCTTEEIQQAAGRR